MTQQSGAQHEAISRREWLHAPFSVARRESIELALAVLGAGFVVPAATATEHSLMQDTDFEGVTLEILQCRSKKAILTVVMEFKNNGFAKVALNPLGALLNYDEYYFIADMRKYFILRDGENRPVAKYAGRVELDPGQTWTFWAKFPAPPPDVRFIEFYTPLTLPFDDVTVTE